MNMKVVHLSCVAPPEIGGIGRSAAKEVSLLRARGIQAQMIAPESEITDRQQESATLKRKKPIFRFGNASILPDLKNDLKQADIIHLHYPFYGVAEPILMQADSLPPIVITYHMDAIAPGLKGAVFALHRKLIQPMLLKSAKTVIVSSYDYAKRSGIKSFFKKYPARVKEIPFGVETDLFAPADADRSRFMIPDEATAFLFVGGHDRAHAFKGIAELLEAFQELPDSTHVLIVGDGDLKETYESDSEARGLRNRVHFLGRLDQKTLIQAYQASDVFVFPSTSRAEAFGLAALEAESCGKPVIASDLPGVRTVVLHGETGLLIRPGDPIDLRRAMMKLHDDATLRRELGARARTHAETFSWDRHIDALIDVYENCRTHE